MKKSLLVVCFSFCSAEALAQERDFYVGFGAGLADVSNSLASTTFVDGLSVIEGARRKISERNRNDIKDDAAFSYHAVVGYSANDNLSVELSFHDFGNTDVSQQTEKSFSDGSTSTGTSTFELSTIAVSLNALLSYPLNGRVSLFTNLGGVWSRQERRLETERLTVRIVNGAVRNFSSETFGYSRQDSHFDVTYGLGTSIQINESFESRIGVTGIELEDGRIFDYGLSLVYRI